VEKSRLRMYISPASLTQAANDGAVCLWARPTLAHPSLPRIATTSPSSVLDTKSIYNHQVYVRDVASRVQ